MNANLVGNLLHLERFDELRAIFEKSPLVINDRLGNPRQRPPPLLDRFDEPLGRGDLAFDVLACFVIRFTRLEEPQVGRADEEGRKLVVL